MNEKILDKLKEIKINMESLKEKNHNEGDEEFESNRELLRRVIDRIYPEKDAKELKNKLVHKYWVITGNETEEYWQNFYLEKIGLSLRIINTILEEGELFGFDDFKPIKEKEETEWQIGSNKLGYFKKRKGKEEK